MITRWLHRWAPGVVTLIGAIVLARGAVNPNSARAQDLQVTKIVERSIAIYEKAATSPEPADCSANKASIYSEDRTFEPAVVVQMGPERNTTQRQSGLVLIWNAKTCELVSAANSRKRAIVAT